MVGKIRHGRYTRPGVLWVLGAVAACTPRSEQKPTPLPQNPVVASPPQPLTTAVTAPAAPQVQLVLTTMAEHTGGEFGLRVPMLQVVLRNDGSQPVAVPPPGLDMLLSLQVVLKTATAVETRRVTVSRAWPIGLQPLAPKSEVHQGLSPLSREQRDVPLPPGRYQVSVCVIPDHDATYHSTFTEQLGGTCSNELELVVHRGK